MRSRVEGVLSKATRPATNNLTEGCPPCPTVQSVVLMLDGLIEVKKLLREL